jgi:L-rhamnose mutarotase
MIRRAFTMRLKPDAEALYRHHHDNVWPELVAEIERSGIASITTFQRGLDLFLVSEIANEDAWDKLWKSEIHRRWAEVMEPLMHLRDDGIVDAGPLEEIFRLSTAAGGQNGKRARKTAKGSPKKPAKKPARAAAASKSKKKPSKAAASKSTKRTGKKKSAKSRR